MNGAYQTCRICGLVTPAGFTHCDSCYQKIDKKQRLELHGEDRSSFRMRAIPKIGKVELK